MTLLVKTQSLHIVDVCVSHDAFVKKVIYVTKITIALNLAIVQKVRIE